MSVGKSSRVYLADGTMSGDPVNQGLRDNQGFNSTTRKPAQHNAVTLVDRVQLTEMLEKPVTLDDVQRVLY